MPKKSEERRIVFEQTYFKKGFYNNIGIDFGVYLLEGFQAVSKQLNPDNTGILEALWDSMHQFKVGKDCFLSAYIVRDENTGLLGMDVFDIRDQLFSDVAWAIKTIPGINFVEISNARPKVLIHAPEKDIISVFITLKEAYEHIKLLMCLQHWFAALPNRLSDWVAGFPIDEKYVPYFDWTEMKTIFATFAVNNIFVWLFLEPEPNKLCWYELWAPSDTRQALNGKGKYSYKGTNDAFEYEAEIFYPGRSLKEYQQSVINDFQEKFKDYLNELRKELNTTCVKFEVSKDRLIYFKDSKSKQRRKREEDIFYWFAVSILVGTSVEKMISHFYKVQDNHLKANENYQITESPTPYQLKRAIEKVKELLPFQ